MSDINSKQPGSYQRGQAAEWRTIRRKVERMLEQAQARGDCGSQIALQELALWMDEQRVGWLELQRSLPISAELGFSRFA